MLDGEHFHLFSVPLLHLPLDPAMMDAGGLGHPKALGKDPARDGIKEPIVSPTYKDVDLRVLQKADGIAFNAAVNDILIHADSEGRRPTRVPLGGIASGAEPESAARSDRLGTLGVSDLGFDAMPSAGWIGRYEASDGCG
jgi:hypothetical protein